MIKKSYVKYTIWLLLLVLLLVACGGADPAEPATNAPVVPEDGAEANTGSAETAVSSTNERFPPEKYEDLEIVTLLPRDAIPAIDDPQFLSAAEADEFYDPEEFIIGVEFNGDARAYSVPLLSNHEIVNDTVGGEKIAVTW